MNLHDRIEEFLNSPRPHNREAQHEDIKQLIKDVLTEVMPEIDPFLYDKKKHIENVTRGIDEGSTREVANHLNNMHYRAGKEHFMRDMQDKIEELGL